MTGVHRDRLFMQPTGKDGGLPPPAIKYRDRKKKGWLLKLRISQPEGINVIAMPGSITRGVRLTSPTIDGSQPVKHLLVINISPLRIASLIKVSKFYLTSQF